MEAGGPKSGPMIRRCSTSKGMARGNAGVAGSPGWRVSGPDSRMQIRRVRAKSANELL
jgi:hypothetical protein